jgi:HSP20 family protein
MNTQLQNRNGNEALEQTNTRTFAPPVDVYEGKDETWLVADLPGVSKDGLTIEIENNELRFRAQARPFLDGEAEFQWARAFRIPTGVDGDKVTADLREGVLVLKLPKPAELKPRKIEVRTA